MEVGVHQAEAQGGRPAQEVRDEAQRRSHQQHIHVAAPQQAPDGGGVRLWLQHA